MSISLKRGNNVIRVIEDTNTDKKVNKKEDYSNVLNVRINRPFSTIGDFATKLKDNNGKNIQLPKVNIKDAVAESISSVDTMSKDEIKQAPNSFDASSNFIPKPNTITDPLKAFGLTDADFEDSDEDTKLVSVAKETQAAELETSIADTADKIAQKYSDYFNDEEDNFEKIPRKKNKMDNY